MRTFPDVGSQLHVLIVEDDDEEVRLYKRALERLGIPHHHFLTDGKEVTDYLEGNGKYADREAYPFPDWLLLDFKMPVITGLDVLKWLRSRPHLQVVPTIMLSNANQPEDVTAAYQLGVNAFFQKPTKFEEMLNLLGLISTFWNLAQRPVVKGRNK